MTFKRPLFQNLELLLKIFHPVYLFTLVFCLVHFVERAVDCLDSPGLNVDGRKEKGKRSTERRFLCDSYIPLTNP